MIRLDALFPVGTEPRRELMWVGVAWGGAILYSAFGFFSAFRSAYDMLFYRWNTLRSLRPGAVMPDFGSLLGRSLAGFLVVALCMIGLAAYHYAYHYQDSKSIYLMRRLPQRWELLRRCAAAPLLCAAASFLLAFLVLLLYFWFYLAVSPEGCVVPGQWARLWPHLIGG